MRYGFSQKKIVNLCQRLIISVLLLLLCSNLVQFFISIDYKPKNQISKELRKFEDSLFGGISSLNQMNKSLSNFSSNIEHDSPRSVKEEERLQSKLTERTLEARRRDLMLLLRQRNSNFPIEASLEMREANLVYTLNQVYQVIQVLIRRF